MEYTSYDKAIADAKAAVAERQRQEAAALAEARNDYYLSVPGRQTQGQGLIGPLSEKDMRMYVDDALAVVRKPLVLKVVEDYGR